MVDHPVGPLCASCGQCCKAYPGSYTPADFGEDVEGRLTELLRGGRTTIDWWEGDVAEPEELMHVYFPRPAMKLREGLVMHPGWDGECTHLGPDGCGLPRAEMPEQCRSLRPRTVEGESCPGMTKKEVALLWRPLQDVIIKVLRGLGAEI